MKYRVLLLLVVACWMVESCGYAEESVLAPVISGGEAEEDRVELWSVEPPEFGDDFATLVAKKTRVVYWATGGASVMSSQSGYPGFGYPMVIYSNVETGEVVSLSVQWGTYQYEYAGSGTAFIEGSYLIDCESGERLLNWGVRDEKLVIWNPDTLHYSLFDFADGTKIVS